jgi:transposase
VEETTGAQWLYTELRPCVTKLIICDPHRNRLLSEGAKNDKIDATKLVRLLKAGLLKEVYHSGEEFIYLRRLTSGYEDLIRSGVRVKNQRAAIFRSKGQDHKKKEELNGSHVADRFVLTRLDQQIEHYERQKAEYEAEFQRLSKKNKTIRLLKSIPGLGNIHAVQIASAVVDPRRFPSAGHLLSYSGLIKHEKMSGGISYGKKSSRYCRSLKKAFKLASHAVIQECCNNPLRDFYNYLIFEKKKAPHVARNAVARRIAVLAYGVMKSQRKFSPYRRCKKKTSSSQS